MEDLLAIHVIQSVKGWVAGQIPAVDRIATDQQFLDRVGGEACGVVCIFVSTGDGHDSLRQQFVHLVMDFARLPPVFESSRKSSGQPQPSVSSREQDRSASELPAASQTSRLLADQKFPKTETTVL
jgi:hypothetical protein